MDSYLILLMITLSFNCKLCLLLWINDNIQISVRQIFKFNLISIFQMYIVVSFEIFMYKLYLDYDEYKYLEISKYAYISMCVLKNTLLINGELSL